MRKIFIISPRHLCVIKIIALVTVAIAAAIAGGAPDIFGI